MRSWQIDDLMLTHFGAQPDRLFLAIGRLSALTCLLDQWIRNLLATLIDDEPMAKYDSMAFYEQAKLTGKERSSLLPPALRTEGEGASETSDRPAS